MGVRRLKRRGFLGVLGGAAVSGPAMAKQAVAQAAAGLDGLSLTGLGTTAGYVSVGDAVINTQTGNYGGVEYDHGNWLLEQLSKLTGLSDEDKAERMDRVYVQNLDPDLAVNRSYSLSAKLQIQKKRNYDRELKREIKDTRKYLADFLKQSVRL